MEPIVQEMRETAVGLERTADANIQAKKGHCFLDVANREMAVDLLRRFQQGYPSNQEYKEYDIGPQFTWRMLKFLHVETFQRHLSKSAC